MTLINGNYREYKLDNGLVVALQSTPTQTISAKLRVNYGTSHEQSGEEGMAHFLEHCVDGAGGEKFDALATDEIRSLFGYSNASTSIGRTFYIGQMLSEDLKMWLDYTTDHVFKPRFDQKRVNEERQRVLREISDYKSQPRYADHLGLVEAFYRGHPKGIQVLGKEEVVVGADLDNLVSFHGRGYHPNNMDLILVGSLPKDVEKIVGDYFSHFSRGENTRRDFPELRPLEKGVVIHSATPESINRENPKGSSAKLMVKFGGPSDNHPDMSTTFIMNRILGGGEESLLFQNVSQRRGLAYHIGSSVDGSYNAGEIQVTASVKATEVETAVGAIFEEFERIKTQKIDQKTIDKRKRLAKYGVAELFESNGGHLSAIEIKLDRGDTPDDFLRAVDKMTPEDIMEVANRYLPDRKDGKYILYIADPLKE